MQQELIAGDTLNFLTSVPDYLASAGWVLHFRLVPRTGTNPAIAIDAVAEGDDHRTQVAASATGAYAPDSYTWNSWVTLAAEVYTVDAGQITIRPNPRSVAAGYDGRSLAVKTRDDLLAAFATFTSSNGTTRSYRIADRERVFNTAADILVQISFWEREVARETAALLAATGQARGGRFYLRQTR